MICKACGQNLPESDFWVDNSVKSGRRGKCKACIYADRRKRGRKGGKRRLSLSTVMILSDVHVPEHDRSFWRAAMMWIKDNKPGEVILSGDFGEYSSVSQHGGANEQKLIDDLTSVKQALDEIRSAGGPDCKITYLEGNHESRLPRAVATWAPTFAGAIDLPEMLELEKRDIEWVPEYRQPVHRGLLRVLHGHQVLGKYGPKHHSAKAADVYGSSPYCEIVYGHVHAAQQFVKPVAGGHISSQSVGCGRTIGADKVRWLAGREAGWHHGFAVAYVTDKVTQVYNVKVRDGRFIWNGRLYDGSEAAHVAASAR